VLLITDMAESCEIVVLVLPAASNASPPSAGDVYMMPAVVYAYRVPQIGDASNRRHVCPPAARGPALRLPVCVCVCVCVRARARTPKTLCSPCHKQMEYPASSPACTYTHTRQGQ
jgi:hypothetical protein